jgi:hypothetical protein
MTRHRALVLTLAAALCLAVAQVAADPVGTAFTYQGKLDQSGSPFTGTATLRFDLYDLPAGGTPLGSVTITDLTITDGLFTVDLDFGPGAFAGQARWLEIAVRAAGELTFTPLAPRQAVRAAPYALFSLTGNGGTSFSLPFVGSVATAGQTGFEVDHTATTGTHSAVLGRNASAGPGASGVRGDATAASGDAVGVEGSAVNSAFGRGVLGRGAGDGGRFESLAADTTNGHAGVNGYAAFTFGVRGVSDASDGVFGLSNATAGTGVHGVGSQSGVSGETSSPTGYGGLFTNSGGGVALRAEGMAQIRTLQILGGSDLAEPFEVGGVAASEAEPGRVVVIDSDHPGRLCLSDRPYDTRVAGVISGAHELAPGLVMRAEGVEHADGSHPVAMSGRVWCYADASYGAIHPGDLLTTSATPGAAMRAVPTRAAGAVLGKAMTGLERGRGLVLVLVSLQ